jgi:LPXTG-site transpeptidase (sortase) family protein
MLFTKTEIDIAKQMIKIGFIIIVACLLLVWITGLVTGIGNISQNKVDVQVKKNTPEVIVNKAPPVKAEAPMFLEIPGYNVNANIESPSSVQVEVLDAALGRGAVYYPGSGYPGANNTLIFGHSTTFKVVRNKAYQIFNNIKNVPPGTLIYVKTQTTVHIYKTRKVERVSKYSAWIEFKSQTPVLTLATCDGFGKASDRWVLTADYVGVQ